MAVDVRERRCARVGTKGRILGAPPLVPTFGYREGHKNNSRWALPPAQLYRSPAGIKNRQRRDASIGMISPTAKRRAMAEKGAVVVTEHRRASDEACALHFDKRDYRRFAGIRKAD